MISVIIPVYNAGDYLEECFNSILGQTYQDFEIIAVDDGSTDDSASICRSYSEKDKRIKYICQPNGGVSSARNNGIEHAKGQWLCFIDADDKFSQNYFEVLLKKSEPGSMVACQFCMNIHDHGKGDKKVLIDNDKQKLLSNLLGKNQNRIHLGSILFDANTINTNDLRFVEGCVRNEDMEFICRYLCLSKDVCVIRYYGYFYRQHESSVMHTLKMTHLSSIEAEERILDFVSKHGLVVDKDLQMSKAVLKFVILSARESNEQIYNFLHEKYDVISSVKFLIRKKVGLRYKISAILYAILKKDLFFKIV